VTTASDERVPLRENQEPVLPARESKALIKGPQRQKTSVGTDLTTRKISSNGSASVEGKQQL
jgi:hypothetical protein